MRALVRDSGKLSLVPDGVAIVTGASESPGTLDALLADADVALSVLGPTAKDSSLHTRTAEALVPAMQRHNVSRFIGGSGAGIDIPGDEKSLRDKIISLAIQRLGGEMVKDKNREYQIYAASHLDWTLVRPPRLKDGPATGSVAHDAHRPGRSSSITRADLAQFLADLVDSSDYVRQAPFVSGK